MNYSVLLNVRSFYQVFGVILVSGELLVVAMNYDVRDAFGKPEVRNISINSVTYTYIDVSILVYMYQR